MALPSNDKIIGDLGHTADHNAIVDEITFIKENYLSASTATLLDFLRKDTASATYATISSPTFSGIPLAPTASVGTNTTQIATTQFVRSEISSLVASAPGTLDTLNELAAALADDPNFATTITQALSNKLDSGEASATYLSQTDASNTYFPRSASGGLLTEDEASNIYLRQDTASSVYITSLNAETLYFPKSSSGLLLTESEASGIYLRQDSASSIYLPISASSTLAPIGYLTSSAAAIIYAPLISPNFSGSPTAPNPVLGSNNNEIATTAFVADAILAVQTGSAVDLSAYLRADTASSLYSTKTINIKTASVDYTATIEDSNYLIKLDSESPIKFILPDNTSTPFPIGTKIDILQINIGQVTASANIGVSLNGNPGTMLSGQWAAASLVKLDTDSWVIIGSIE